jgi:TetR/AcrR family transcriptional regulator, upper aerobic nicotinate degradation pathway regulator
MRQATDKTLDKPSTKKPTRAKTVTKTASKTGTKAKPTTRDPEGTRSALLSAAVAEFAREGYGGARIDRISKAALSHDRMVYYYFGSKEDLYRESIEWVYQSLVEAELKLELDLDRPVEALKAVIAFNWHYYIEHPELISILNTENLYKARHIKGSKKVEQFASPQLATIQAILSKGVEARMFRADFTAEQLFLTIASLTYFYLSNVHTLSNYLSRDLARTSALDDWLAHVTRVVIDSLSRPSR